MSGAMTFRPAVRENVPLLIGLTSGTGGGKTYSAMRIAQGIAGPGKRFAVVDTEKRRARHYADDFQFDVMDLEPPFTPERCTAALKAAEKAGYPCIVLDSATHEWAGEGGVLKMQQEAQKRMAGPNADYKRLEAMNWPAWREPKERHAVFREGLLQIGVPLVLCFRGKTGQKPGIDPETGKKCLIETPFRPITSQDDLPFELTVLLVLSQEKPGTVDLSQPNKISKPVRPLIRDGEVLDEAFGSKLAAWARGGEAPPQQPRRTLGQAVEEIRAKVAGAATVQELDDFFAEAWVSKAIDALNARDDKSVAQDINAQVSAKMAELHARDAEQAA